MKDSIIALIQLFLSKLIINRLLTYLKSILLMH